MGRGSPYASILPFRLFLFCLFSSSVFLIFKCFESLYFLLCHSINVIFIDYEFFLFSILFVDFLTILLFPPLYLLFCHSSSLFLSFLTPTSCLFALHNILLLDLFLNILTLLLPFISDIYTQLCSLINPFNKH